MSNPTLAEFFLNAKSSVILYDTLEVSHSSFSKVYRIVRNNRMGANFDAGAGVVPFEYYPLKITRMNSSMNLDQSLKITLGDLGDLLPKEIARIAQADTFLEKPSVIYRAYRSDNMMEPVIGPIDLQMSNITLTKEGSAFEAKPPTLNGNSTGELYTLSRFPGLRGFLY